MSIVSFSYKDGCAVAVWALGYKLILSCSQKRIIVVGLYDVQLSPVEINGQNMKRPILTQSDDLNLNQVAQNNSLFLSNLNYRLRETVTHTEALNQLSLLMVYLGRLFGSNGNKPFHADFGIRKPISCTIPRLFDNISSLPWNAEAKDIDSYIGPQFR